MKKYEKAEEERIKNLQAANDNADKELTGGLAAS